MEKLTQRREVAMTQRSEEVSSFKRELIRYLGRRARFGPNQVGISFSKIRCNHFLAKLFAALLLCNFA